VIQPSVMWGAGRDEDLLTRGLFVIEKSTTISNMRSK